MSAHANKLQDTIENVARLIFQCEQALSVSDTIVEKASSIDERKLNHFFVPVQIAFFNTLALDMCKMFESSRRYNLHTIPAAVLMLDAAHLTQRQTFEEVCLSYGLAPRSAATMTNECLIEFYKDEIVRRLGSSEITDKLESFKNIRDKWVAHSEAGVAPFPLDRQAAEYLLSFAKKIVSDLGLVFFNMIYCDDDGSFALDSYATRTSQCARRILEHMGIIALEGMDDRVRGVMFANTIQQAEWSDAVKQQVIESFRSQP